MTSPSAPCRKALSKIASNRLQKELVEWQVNPPSGFKHKVTDNLQRWVIEVNGAPGTLYTNETYQLQVDFPEYYPMEAPQVVFTPPAPLHPHVYSNGHICLEDPPVTANIFYPNCESVQVNDDLLGIGVFHAFCALRVLKSAYAILFEDTKHLGKLLHHYNITPPYFQLSYQKFNESQREQAVLKRLQEGEIVALISDAGTPGISDPGMDLAKLCVDKNMLVTPIPGLLLW